MRHPLSDTSYWIFNKGLRSSATTANYNLNVFVHIVRSSSGHGFGAEISSSIVSLLNSSFASAGIQFKLQGADFIDNSYYYNNINNGGAERLFTVNTHGNAIDIYVLGRSTAWWYAGVANGIPAKSLIIHGNYYNTSTLAHEMGHCLGLYHTYHGTVKEGGDKRQCKEFVDGSNSTTCGDYISDTPADPYKWSDCSYVGTDLDEHGQRYAPDPSNYMSYAGKPCRIRFTNGQIKRMKQSIDINDILKRVLCARLPIAKIEGVWQGIHLKSRRTIHVSVSTNILQGVSSYQWGGANCRILSGQGTSSATIQVDDNPYTDDLPFNIQLNYANACDSKGVRVDGFIIGKPRSSFSLSPNPATDVVTLKLTEPDDGILSPQGQGSLTTKSVTNTYEIQLWNGLTMLKSFKTNQPTFQISTAGLPTGLYFVRVIKDGQTYTEKLIKN